MSPGSGRLSNVFCGLQVAPRDGLGRAVGFGRARFAGRAPLRTQVGGRGALEPLEPL